MPKLIFLHHFDTKYLNPNKNQYFILVSKTKYVQDNGNYEAMDIKPESVDEMADVKREREEKDRERRRSRSRSKDRDEEKKKRKRSRSKDRYAGWGENLKSKNF